MIDLERVERMTIICGCDRVAGAPELPVESQVRKWWERDGRPLRDDEWRHFLAASAEEWRAMLTLNDAWLDVFLTLTRELAPDDDGDGP